MDLSEGWVFVHICRARFCRTVAVSYPMVQVPDREDGGQGLNRMA